MIRVIVESPFAGDVERNVAYARACVADSLRRGEAPFASHLLYTQPGILDDEVLAERSQGIAAGFAWRDVAQLTAVYVDLGITAGMYEGVDDAHERGIRVEVRYLPVWPPVLHTGGIVGDGPAPVLDPGEAVMQDHIAEPFAKRIREGLDDTLGRMAPARANGPIIRCQALANYEHTADQFRHTTARIQSIPVFAEFSDELMGCRQDVVDDDDDEVSP